MPPMLSIALLLATAADPSSSGAVGYYRFPAIHGDTIVFGADGDLWQVSRTGWQDRAEDPSWNMPYAFCGHMVLPPPAFPRKAIE